MRAKKTLIFLGKRKHACYLTFSIVWADAFHVLVRDAEDGRTLFSSVLGSQVKKTICPKTIHFAKKYY